MTYDPRKTNLENVIDMVKKHALFLDEAFLPLSSGLFFTDRAYNADSELCTLAERDDIGLEACLRTIPVRQLFGTNVEKILFREAAWGFCQKMVGYNLSLIGDKAEAPFGHKVRLREAKGAETNLRAMLRVGQTFAQQIKDGLSAKQKQAAPELMQEVETVLSGKPLVAAVMAQPLLDYRQSLSFH